jgi:hypothetical protein
MAIRSDSYSSTAEVKAMTRHLLDGQTAFNSTTRPTATDLEKYIDRASGTLNLAISAGGFRPANIYTNSTAKLACDDWTTARAAEYAELSHRGVGYSDAEGSRTAAFRNPTKSANEFVTLNSLGFVRLGVSQTYRMSDGLAFTGMDKQSDRTDRDDTNMEQPYAERHQFDNVSGTDGRTDE